MGFREEPVAPPQPSRPVLRPADNDIAVNRAFSAYISAVLPRLMLGRFPFSLPHSLRDRVHLPVLLPDRQSGCRELCACCRCGCSIFLWGSLPRSVSETGVKGLPACHTHYAYTKERPLRGSRMAPPTQAAAPPKGSISVGWLWVSFLNNSSHFSVCLLRYINFHSAGIDSRIHPAYPACLPFQEFLLHRTRLSIRLMGFFCRWLLWLPDIRYMPPAGSHPQILMPSMVVLSESSMAAVVRPIGINHLDFRKCKDLSAHNSGNTSGKP